MSRQRTSATSPVLEPSTVRRIAELAQLQLQPDEAERMTRDLSEILAYVTTLEEVDVEGVAPTAHVQLERLPLRPDIPSASLSVEAALAEAPATAEQCFVVPPFSDEG